MKNRKLRVKSTAELGIARKTRQSQRKFRQAGEDAADRGDMDRQREADGDTETEGESKGEREPHSDTAFVVSV